MKFKPVDHERRKFLQQGVKTIAALAWGIWSRAGLLEARRNNRNHVFEYKPKKTVEKSQPKGEQTVRLGDIAVITDVFNDWREDHNYPTVPVRVKIPTHQLWQSRTIVSASDNYFLTNILGGDIKLQVENGDNPPNEAYGQNIQREDGYAYFYLDAPKKSVSENGKDGEPVKINEIVFKRESYNVGTKTLQRWEVKSLNKDG